MSASQEKRRRQQEREQGLDKKQLEQLEEQKKRKKTKISVTIIVIVFVLLVAFVVVINSSFIRRSVTAVSIGDVDFTVADYNYHYNIAYYEYYNEIYTNYPDYASSLLPNTSTPFESQIYDNETGQTWASRFEEMTLESMKKTSMLYAEAMKNGFALDEDQQKELDNTIAAEEESAYTYGHSSFDKFLSSYYGRAVNKNVYVKNLTMKFISAAYSEHVMNSYTYEDKELEEYYETKKDYFDMITYRYIFIQAEEVDESLYEGEEAIAAAKEEAVADAEKIAKSYAADITDEESFIAAALDFDAETYAKPESTLHTYMGSLLGSYYGPWLLDASRVEGDVTTATMANGAYVVYFINHDDNHYETVNVRHILISPETISETDYEDDTEAYEAAVEAARETAKKDAEALYQQWKDEGGTEELFEQFADEHSSDMAVGGLYEKVNKGRMVPEFDAWCFDPARKPGDTGIVESSSYGYHIMYFVGNDILYSNSLAQDELRTAAYTEWETEAMKNYTEPTTKWIYSLVG